MVLVVCGDTRDTPHASRPPSSAPPQEGDAAVVGASVLDYWQIIW